MSGVAQITWYQAQWLDPVRQGNKSIYRCNADRNTEGCDRYIQEDCFAHC